MGQRSEIRSSVDTGPSGRIPVLLLVRSLTSGGSERQLTEVAKALDRSLWEPHVGCFHDDGLRAAELRAAGVPIVRFPVRSFASVGALRGAHSLGAYLRLHRIALTHTFDTPMNIFGVLCARFYDCPVVLSSQRAHRSLSLPRERRLLRLTDRLVDAVVVNCEAVRKHLTEEEGVPARRIQVCFNGIDPQVFFPRKQPRPEALSGATLVIGCVCVLRPEKGLPTLLDAFSAVRPLCPGLKLVLAGSGPMLGPLKEQAMQLGIAGDIHFEPATPNVADWLRAIDIFVLPSLSEALSNTLMEAMLCGCAVVASRVGGNPELALDGQTGLTFPAGDAAALAGALRRLIECERLRRQLAAAGTRYIEERFTIQQSVQRMEDIYREALASMPHAA